MTETTLGARMEDALGSTSIRNHREWARATRNTLEADARRTQGALLIGQNPLAHDPSADDLGCMIAIVVEQMNMVVDNIDALAPHV